MRMHEHERRSWRSAAPCWALIAATFVAVPATAQQPAASSPPPPRPDSAAAAERARLTADDHRQMMAQLGITALRPGPSGNEQAPNHANYDSALANPFTSLPPLMRLNDGRRVTNARLWQQRRREIIEGFEREVYGRIPRNVPKVIWSVATTDTGRIGGKRVVAKQLVGRVDNSANPELSLDIPLTVVVPAEAQGPV